jgi:hypothetical protein
MKMFGHVSLKLTHRMKLLMVSASDQIYKSKQKQRKSQTKCLLKRKSWGQFLGPKIKIAVVPVTRPTLCFVPKKTDSDYFIGKFLFLRVVFMLPTSFLTVDISQYYLSVPLVCLKKLVFSNISKRIAFGQQCYTLPNIARARCPFSRRLQMPLWNHRYIPGGEIK